MAFAHDEMWLDIEGGTLLGPISSAVAFFEAATTTVTVTDGQLTITIFDQGGADPYAVICGLTVD